MQQRAEEAELPISICGESAGRPLEALTLIALGYRRLSMQASRIAPVKLLIRSVDVSILSKRVQAVLDSKDQGESIRNSILSIAIELGLKI
jgi:phosphotransferase system enzyme I (PtsP)